MKLTRLAMTAAALLGVALTLPIAPTFAVPTDGTVNIVNVYSQKCFDDPAWTTTPSFIDQWTCHGSRNQEWRLTPSASVAGDFTIVNEVSNLCLDAEAFGRTDGTRVNQYFCTGGSNQLWELLPDEGTGMLLVPAYDTSLCAAVSPRMSTADYVPIALYHCSLGSAWLDQLWELQ